LSSIMTIPEILVSSSTTSSDLTLSDIRHHRRQRYHGSELSERTSEKSDGRSNELLFTASPLQSPQNSPLRSRYSGSAGDSGNIDTSVYSRGSMGDFELEQGSRSESGSS
jgi:hypothetical protein